MRVFYTIEIQGYRKVLPFFRLYYFSMTFCARHLILFIVLRMTVAFVIHILLTVDHDLTVLFKRATADAASSIVMDILTTKEYESLNFLRMKI